MPDVFTAPRRNAPTKQRQTKSRKIEPIILGKTKQTILLLLARHVFLTPEMICQAAFGQSVWFIRRHLNELTEAGWVLRAAYLRETDFGKAARVYCLSSESWAWVAEHGLPTPHRFRPSEEIGKVSPHTMGISAFGVSAERYCRQTTGVELAQFWHERVIPYAVVKMLDGTSRSLRPDAWMQ